MAQDNVYYCDFSKEIPLPDWEVIHADDKTFSLKQKITTPGGEFLFLAAAYRKPGEIATDIQSVTYKGKEYHFDRKFGYLTRNALRKAALLTLDEGENEFIISGPIGKPDTWKDTINCALARPMEKAAPPSGSCSVKLQVEKESFPSSGDQAPDLTGFIPGIGTENYKGPGRFGYSKGDGVLDCAMPYLGSIDKLYLLGHPKYKKTFRWNYSTLPEGASYHGSNAPADTGFEDDKITINHLSSRWETRFDGKSFACTYSLATPGIITENETGILRLSNLEFAGDYRYMMIPRKDGSLEVTTLRDLKDLEMGENFLLLFGCTEFPDLPLLLVFQKQPENMQISYDPHSGRLTEIVFHNTPLIITATPFGFESFEPIQPDDSAFLEKAAKKCRFWSRAFLAYPIACEEYFRNDEEKEEVTIIQKFTYRYIRDDWGTIPLELAPIPPAATLTPTSRTEGVTDFGFPTKFGYLKGKIGKYSSYTLPFMPPYRKFPLRESCDTRLAAMLKEGMDSYFKVVSHFPETIQSYPYAGSLVEPFALASTQLQFMDPEDREKLRLLLEKRLATACDPDHSYDYPVINHGHMMRWMPEDEDVLEYTAGLPRKHLFNWYERQEPFTGTTFTICYLNVGMFYNILKGGDKEEIRNLRYPLVENDWGVGLTFYYMYLAALASGSFKPIREHWDLLKSVFSFFEKMHDWACMGTGYSDNAILWVEGANYGAFTSFIHMARVVEDDAACQKAQYMAAKQFALRSAVFCSTQHYFHKFYNVEPWYIAKFFQEEQCVHWQHMGVPVDLDKHRYRDDGVYNLTTEGLYPEIFDGFLQKMPGELKTVMEKLRAFISEQDFNPRMRWEFTQQFASLLTYMAHSPDHTREDLEKVIALAKSKNHWLGKWRGIHIFSRRLPEHFFETLLHAWESAKHHPCHILHHQEILVDDALWTGEKAVLNFRLARKGGKALVQFGIRKRPATILLNGKNVEGKYIRNTILEIPFAEEEGTLELLF